MSGLLTSGQTLEPEADNKIVCYLIKHKKERIILLQLIGTFVFSYGINCSSYTLPVIDKHPNQFHDFFISLSLYFAIFLIAPLGAGAVNPSVSLALYLGDTQNTHTLQSNQTIQHSKEKERKDSFKQMIIVAVVQLLGAFLAALLCYLLYESVSGPYKTDSQPGAYQVFTHFVGEMVGTMLFVFMILMVTTPETTFLQEQFWVQAFIPLSLYLARKISFHIGGLNPAIVIAVQLIELCKGTAGFTDLALSILISLGSILGAIIGSLYFKKVFYQNTIKWKQA